MCLYLFYYIYRYVLENILCMKLYFSFIIQKNEWVERCTYLVKFNNFLYRYCFMLQISSCHEPKICIETFNLTKENGVPILIVSPHFTGKVQPLNIGMYESSKTAYNKAVDSWIPGLRLGNICAGFKATGIFPLDGNVFTHLDFTHSEVTDRQVNVKNYQNEINRPVQDNESRTLSTSVLEHSCRSSNQPVQLEECGDQGTHSDSNKILVTLWISTP